MGDAEIITLTIDYGYDIHSIEMDKETYAEINAGKLVEIDGQGFNHEEDGGVTDHWVFNREPKQVYFWLDNGAEFYAQKVWIEGI